MEHMSHWSRTVDDMHDCKRQKLGMDQGNRFCSARNGFLPVCISTVSNADAEKWQYAWPIIDETLPLIDKNGGFTW